MFYISNKKLTLISTIVITLTILINIGAFFVLPSKILVQINQSHTMSKLVVLPIIPILQYLVYIVSKEKYDSFVSIVGLLMILIADLGVIAINFI